MTNGPLASANGQSLQKGDYNMADYTGRGPVDKGNGASGQFYQEIKWSGGHNKKH